MEAHPNVIEWPCQLKVSSVSVETALKSVVLKEAEFGCGRDLSHPRRHEIETACIRHGMTCYQAFSFRRHLLRSQPGGMKRVSQSSAMGSAAGQLAVATLFEEAVGTYLRDKLNLAVVDEEQQRASGRVGGGSVPTPDFLLQGSDQLVMINSRPVNWIECKVFYGSASLANDPRVPMGRLGKTVTRYNEAFGPGAIVFGLGFCADLETHLSSALLLI